MDHEKQGGTGSRIVKGEDDALADAADAANDLAVDGVDGWIDRPEDEGAVQREPLEPASDDVPRQRVEVDDNVGEFGDVIS
jgi:hypothetical protein